jgi:hypothetical protein
LFLEQVLNLQLVLPVKNGLRLLVPVDAFHYVLLLYAHSNACQAKTGKLGLSRF